MFVRLHSANYWLGSMMCSGSSEHLWDDIADSDSVITLVPEPEKGQGIYNKRLSKGSAG